VSTSQEQILNAAADLLRDGHSVSLDAVAAQIGLTKAGLIHHFRTKEDLMLGLVDHVARQWDEELRSTVGDPVDLTPRERIGGYARLALERDADEADIAMLADPRLRAVMTRRWVEHFEAWVQLDDLPPGPERAALTAVRLIADGAWFDSATNVFPLTTTDRPAVLAVVDTLLESAHS